MWICSRARKDESINLSGSTLALETFDSPGIEFRFHTKLIQRSECAMNCPVCKTPQLISTELESDLTSFRCPECRGNWIRGAGYWKWLEEHGPNLPERSDRDSGLSLAEPGISLDCPECRFRMVKYLVGHGFTFTLKSMRWLQGHLARSQ